MLCQFSFQNFKSYKDETTFDFRAMAIPEFQDALIDHIIGPSPGKNAEGGAFVLILAYRCGILIILYSKEGGGGKCPSAPADP